MELFLLKIKLEMKTNAPLLTMVLLTKNEKYIHFLYSYINNLPYKMRVCKHVFFGGKIFLGFFFIFLSKNIDFVIFCAMIYIVRRYT